MSYSIDSAGYKFVVDNSAILQLGAYLEANFSGVNIVILVDDNTRRHCLPILISKVPSLANVSFVVMPAGEENKTMAVLEILASQLLDIGADRSTVLVNLGGGVVGDMGGLLASLFMRGISYIQVPTSLMAMVDASVGGKTGVNLLHHKNMLGVFSSPAAIFIDPVFLVTLPKEELRSGFAEVIKHSCIANVPAFSELPDAAALDATAWLPLIIASVSFKYDIVSADFTDRHQRKILNFGHTVGHALESYSLEHGNRRLLHGEAIALGLQVELLLSAHYTELPMAVVRQWVRYIRSHFPELTVQVNPDSFLRYLQADKKNKRRQISCVLLGKEGEPVIDFPVEEERVLAALNSLATSFSETTV